MKQNKRVLIRAEKLSKFYNKGQIKALNDLDLEIYEGETFGLPLTGGVIDKELLAWREYA